MRVAFLSLCALHLAPDHGRVLKALEEAWNSSFLAACVNVSIPHERVCQSPCQDKEDNHSVDIQQGNAPELADGMGLLLFGHEHTNSLLQLKNVLFKSAELFFSPIFLSSFK